MDINSRKHCRLYRNQNPLLPLPFPEVNPSDALMEKGMGNEKNGCGKDPLPFMTKYDIMRVYNMCVQ